MARARLETEWDQTALIISTLAEINRDRKKRARPYTAMEFHPFAKRKPVAREMASIDVLKGLVGRGSRRH